MRKAVKVAVAAVAAVAIGTGGYFGYQALQVTPDERATQVAEALVLDVANAVLNNSPAANKASLETAQTFEDETGCAIIGVSINVGKQAEQVKQEAKMYTSAHEVGTETLGVGFARIPLTDLTLSDPYAVLFIQMTGADSFAIAIAVDCSETAKSVIPRGAEPSGEQAK